MSRILSLKSFLAALTIVFAVGVVAAPWNSLGPKRKIITVIFSGNYKSSRLMADLIQNECRQPYILFPAVDDDTRIFYCPPTNKGNSLQIREDRFNEFIRTLNPKRIIVLGDERYVPRRYIEMLDGTIPVVRIEGRSWNRVAEELTFLLNLSNLGKDYKRLREQLLTDDQLYRPVSRPAEPVATPAEAPAATADAPIVDNTAPAADAAAPAEAPAAAPAK